MNRDESNRHTSLWWMIRRFFYAFSCLSRSLMDDLSLFCASGIMGVRRAFSHVCGCYVEERVDAFYRFGCIPLYLSERLSPASRCVIGVCILCLDPVEVTESRHILRTGAAKNRLESVQDDVDLDGLLAIPCPRLFRKAF